MNHRFEVLDIFRGLFASLVFFFHLAPFTDTVLFHNAFVDNSDMFVDFFFVLSGFVITYRYESLAGYRDFTRFFWKRLLRLYPLHLTMLFIFLGMEILKVLLIPYVQINQPDNPHNNPYTFVSSLLLLNSTPLFGARDVSWNIPSWSISAEMLSYLVFGLCMWLINCSGNQTRRLLAYGLILFIATACLVGLTGSYQLNFSFDYGFLRGIIGFFTGVLCYNFFRFVYPWWKTLSGAFFSIAEGFTLSLLLLAVAWGDSLKSVGLLYEPLFFLCIVFFAFEKGLLSHLLKRLPILQDVGKYSYSIYMTHAFIISMFNVVFIRILHFAPSAYVYLFVPNYLLVYGFSAWTYRNIEMRFKHYGKNTRTSPAATPVAVSLTEKMRDDP